MFNAQKKKLIIDFILNIFATAIPILVIQLCILPLVNKFSPNEYGLIITYVSLFTLFSQPIRESLDNIKLLTFKSYKDIEEKGDFNRYAIYYSILDAIFIIVGYFIISKEISIIGLLLIIIISLLSLIRNYFGAFFRINLNYCNILISNLLLTIGYIFGFLLYRITGYWEFIYLIGNVFSFIFIIVKTKPYKEGFKKSKFFKTNLISTIILVIASFFVSLTNYVDKLILYPMLGSTVVAIYYASTIFGKIIMQFLGPVNSVILSYLAKSERVKRVTFIKYLGFVICVAIIGFLFCLLISDFTLGLLYPNLKMEAKKFVPIATATAMVNLVIMSISPFVLRFKKITWQLIINIVCVILYLGFALGFYLWFGLFGFYVGILVTYLIKVVVLMLIFMVEKKDKAVGVSNMVKEGVVN